MFNKGVSIVGFHCQSNKYFCFNSLSELKEYVIIEKANTEFIPIKYYLDNNASFIDDAYFGSKHNWLTFNDEGFIQFCRKFKIPIDFIMRLEEKELTSKVLNDHIRIGSFKKELEKSQFVVDKHSNIISGIVSNTYIDYSNKDFLEDIYKVYPKLFDEFEMVESYVINTKLYLRLLSPKIISGYAKGKHYEGEDISQIGLQIKNSMIGNSSVKIDYYIYRAICSNGLVVDTFNSKNRILHSGKRESFIQRLEEKINPIMSEIKHLPKIIKELVDIEYNPYTLAILGAADFVYKIIPLNDYQYEKRNKLKKKYKIEFDALQMSNYPKMYAGTHSKEVFQSVFRDNQSMFDYINVFTEYANSNNLNKEQKIYIEEKTGDFVSWILQNKTKIKKENSIKR